MWIKRTHFCDSLIFEEGNDWDVQKYLDAKTVTDDNVLELTMADLLGGNSDDSSSTDSFSATLNSNSIDNEEKKV